MSDKELGAYLRARREALAPGDVGLPGSARRRTPGLRRSELAAVAGLSVEYLTRLEQGRDRNPSTQVLGALADALRMTQEERAHLRLLAKVSSGDALHCPGGGEPPARTVRPSLRALLDRLEPAPAVLVNRITEVLAYTVGFERLARPLGMLDGDAPVLARYVFSDPRARAAHPDWHRLADEHAAALKLEAGRGDPYAAELVAELSFTAGAAFTDRLAAVPRPPVPEPVVRVVHPEAGELRLTREELEPAGGGGLRLLVHLPADAPSAAALDRVTGRAPGALRAVSG
uniref:helix-turn-helix domain-containing protein n=1 Tax=Nonomuraea pusilla TaxID=46177 RepID=UPI0006E20F18|nr:helix-turn-helix transcriptional regulator [Nonomuraea pusilla]